MDEYRKAIFFETLPLIENWLGHNHNVFPSGSVTIRVHTANSVIATQVDDEPNRITCILTLEQDSNEDWPLEVYDRDGYARNITLNPGEMVLLESSTILHGRPFPFLGGSYATLISSYEVLDSNMDNHNLETLTEIGFDAEGDVAINDDEEEDDMDNTANAAAEEPDPLSTDLHRAAARGDLREVKRILSRTKMDLNAKDKNGWQPLHEAAAAGHIDVVMHLVENGADLESVTKSGGTALWWAKQTLHPEDVVIMYLEEIGAPHDSIHNEL